MALEAQGNNSRLHDEIKKLFTIYYGDSLEKLLIKPWTHLYPFLYNSDNECEIVLFLTSPEQENTCIGDYKPIKTSISINCVQKNTKNCELSYRVSDLEHFKKQLEDLVWDFCQKDFNFDLDKKLED